MKTFFLLLLYFVAAQSRTIIPEPPYASSPIGPFDLIDNKTGVSPPGDDQEDGYNTKNMFQGDIKDPGQRTGGRIGKAGTRTPWPNAVIPYVFDCSVLSIKRAVKATYDAMEEWEKRTCVRFVKKQPHHKVYLEFIRAAGCWATYVGYKGKKTQISIGKGCEYKHVMIHELGHVIGFWHEQSRPDRDDYITINYANVYSFQRYNFDKVKEQVDNRGEPYDFNSIMHYPFNAFAIDKRQNTIFPRDSSILSTATPYRGLSEIDVRQTRKMYRCDRATIARAVTKGSIPSSKIGEATVAGTKCEDHNKYCKSWADAGFCVTSPDPMLKVCPKSCGVCGEVCEDSERYRSDCPAWAEFGYCVRGPETTDHIFKFMNTNCKRSCGLCTPAPVTKPTTKPTTTLPPTTTLSSTMTSPTTTPEMTTTKLSTTLQTTTVSSTVGKPDRNFTGVRCTDRSDHCGAWADDGRCKTDRWVYDNCLLSCKRFTVCDKEMIKPTGFCSEPLGVHSNKFIPDNRMYATTVFSPGGGWYAPASSGRLYKKDDHVNKRVGAWCADPNNNREKYLQIDFDERKNITALATQGRDVYFEHVKSYSLAFSNDRSIWNEYREGGVKKVFDGNCDHVTPVLNILENAQNARYIRIYPIKYIGAACLRVEVYGCKY